jgi:hypothetical protein
MEYRIEAHFQNFLVSGTAEELEFVQLLDLKDQFDRHRLVWSNVVAHS